MVFVNRRRGDDRFLEWKIGIFSVAAGVAMVGMYSEERWMINVALILLLSAMFLRFLPGRADPEEHADDEEDA